TIRGPGGRARQAWGSRLRAAGKPRSSKRRAVHALRSLSEEETGGGVKGAPVALRSGLPGLRGSWLLPAVLSTTAGAVDVIGFLALGGLFTAHITGNLCVLATHYITGGFSQVGQLLSVPVFIAVLGVVTLAFGRAEKVSD